MKKIIIEVKKLNQTSKNFNNLIEYLDKNKLKYEIFNEKKQ